MDERLTPLMTLLRLKKIVNFGSVTPEFCCLRRMGNTLGFVTHF